MKVGFDYGSSHCAMPSVLCKMVETESQQAYSTILFTTSQLMALEPR
ncbi:hypothetical protein PSFL107428_11360 [Pseudoalteromonas maricaloris]